MNTPTKKKKPTLKEQLDEANRMLNIANNSVREQIEQLQLKDRQYDSMLAKKEKEMCDILNNVLVSMGEKSPSFYSMGIGQRETVPALAGQLMGAIARVLEKNNLQTTIIQELEDQVAWFRSLIEKAFGPKIVKAKTNISAVESVLKDLDDQAENLINGKDNKKKK